MPSMSARYTILKLLTSTLMLLLLMTGWHAVAAEPVTLHSDQPPPTLKGHLSWYRDSSASLDINSIVQLYQQGLFLRPRIFPASVTPATLSGSVFRFAIRISPTATGCSTSLRHFWIRFSCSVCATTSSAILAYRATVLRGMDANYPGAMPCFIWTRVKAVRPPIF